MSAAGLHFAPLNNQILKGMKNHSRELEHVVSFLSIRPAGSTGIPEGEDTAQMCHVVKDHVVSEIGELLCTSIAILPVSPRHGLGPYWISFCTNLGGSGP